MLTKARVIKTDGEIATVEVERKSACDGCHKNQDGEGCSICSLTGGNRKFSARAYNRVGAKEGDTVEVSSSSSRVLLYSAIVFLLPVAVGIALYFLANAMTHKEVYAYSALAAGFVLSFVAIWIYSKKTVEKRCDIEIARVLGSGESDTTGV